MQGAQPEEAPSATREAAASVELPSAETSSDQPSASPTDTSTASPADDLNEGTAPLDPAVLSASAEPTIEPPHERPPGRPGRWLAFTLAVLLAFVGVVIALNGSLYSASGFVERYLDALQRRDVGSAESMAGVVRPQGTSSAALAPGALDSISDVQLRSDEVRDGGVHRIVMGYRMGGTLRESTFTVEQAPSLFGLFDDWTFQASPIVPVEIGVRNADSLTVDGASVDVTSTDAAGGSVMVAAFTPSILALGADDRYFSAEPVDVVVTGPDAAPAALTVTASAAFVDDVQEKLDAFLDECVTQQVLLPAACPFGKSIEDRVLAAPVWTMVGYPEIRIDPGVDGSWDVPATIGTAHISVPVQSLFDGTTSTLDEDVPFEVSYRITVGADRVLTINAA
ncbi:hypothetical protein [Naasia lichenicola]|uniref:DUF4878 domain-containing protein n=1 Tax=Naasia lichenicola TaxID=2565933 RepID=A0A4S4FHK9_9MICO|nr:hypothetical protein [Naasia lichenicola]THG29498.1 hypothetical protein E6C64_12440 [Naasia lichenicola]